MGLRFSMVKGLVIGLAAWVAQSATGAALAQDAPFEVQVLPNPVPAGSTTTLFARVSTPTGAADIDDAEVLLDGEPLGSAVIGDGLLASTATPQPAGMHILSVVGSAVDVTIEIEFRDFTRADVREDFLRELVLILDSLLERGIISRHAFLTVRAQIFHAGGSLWNRVDQAVHHLALAHAHADRFMPLGVAEAFGSLLEQAQEIVSAPFPAEFIQDMEQQKVAAIQGFFQALLAIQGGAVVYTGTKADAVAFADQVRELTNALNVAANEGTTEVTVGGQQVTISYAIGHRGSMHGGGPGDGHHVSANGGQVNYAVGGKGANGTGGTRGGDGGNAVASGGSVAIAVAGNGGAGGAPGGDGGDGGRASATPADEGKGFSEGGAGGDGGDGSDSGGTAGGDGGDGGRADVGGDGDAQPGDGGKGGNGGTPPATGPVLGGGDGGDGGAGGRGSTSGNGNAEGGDGGKGGDGGDGNGRPGGTGGVGGDGEGGTVGGTGTGTGGKGGDGGVGGEGTPRGGNGGDAGDGGVGGVGTGGTASGGDGGKGGDGGNGPSGGGGGDGGDGGDAKGPTEATRDPGDGGNGGTGGLGTTPDQNGPDGGDGGDGEQKPPGQ